jgi:hypothetical protein
MPEKKLLLGTGLSSTLLSSQRTTTHQKTDRLSATRSPGDLLNFTFTVSHRQIRGQARICRHKTNCEGTTKHYTAVSRADFAGFRQDGRRGPPRGPACSPVTLAARQQYSLPPRPPNRPPPPRKPPPTAHTTTGRNGRTHRRAAVQSGYRPRVGRPRPVVDLDDGGGEFRARSHPFLIRAQRCAGATGQRDGSSSSRAHATATSGSVRVAP